MNLEGFNQLTAIGGIVAGLAFAIVAELLSSGDDNNDGRVSVIVGFLSTAGILLIASTILFGLIVLVRTEMSPAVTDQTLRTLQTQVNRTYWIFLVGLAAFAFGGGLLGFLRSKLLGWFSMTLVGILTLYIIWIQRYLENLR